MLHILKVASTQHQIALWFCWKCQKHCVHCFDTIHGWAHSTNEWRIVTLCILVYVYFHELKFHSAGRVKWKKNKNPPTHPIRLKCAIESWQWGETAVRTQISAAAYCHQAAFIRQGSCSVNRVLVNSSGQRSKFSWSLLHQSNFDPWMAGLRAQKVNIWSDNFLVVKRNVYSQMRRISPAPDTTKLNPVRKPCSKGHHCQ